MESVADKRSWVEVNLKKLQKNYELYSENQKTNAEIMAVVKADAYGHGDQIIAKFLSDKGVRNFAVASIDEAIRIRKAGIIGQILILGYTPVERIPELAQFDITQTLISEEYAEMIATRNFSIKCQFALDTGMRRIGLNTEAPDECERVIRKYHSKLNLNGLFTHLCVADTPGENAFTEHQIALFEGICHKVKDLNLPYCHCMNSAGGLWHHSKLSCFSRLGIILYGLKPDYMNTLPDGIEPVLSWKSVVCMVKNVKPGDTIGYGRSFTIKKPMTIATIPTGYADGYSRLLSNRGYVLINGKRAAIVGRVCMDQMMVDVTDIPDVHINSEVVLVGKSGESVITADDIANLYGTIGYEVVCGINNKRVARVYVQ